MTASHARGYVPFVGSLDLVLVAVTAVLIATALLSGHLGGPLRALLGLSLLAFFPGYGVVAALYPAARVHGAAASHEAGLVASLRSRGLSWPERLAVAVGTSLALSPLVALVLAASGVGLELVPAVLVLAGIALGGCAVGALRRGQLPADRRATVPTAWLSLPSARGGAGGAGRVLSWVLALAMVTSTVAVGYAVFAPPRGEAYTEASLLTEGESLVAANYTTDLEQGESVSLVVEVENQGPTATTYTVVPVVERVRVDGERLRVLQRNPHDPVGLPVGSGATERRAVDVAPSTLGEDLRLSFYVYAGDPPATPSAETADQHLYLWLDVGAGSQ